MKAYLIAGALLAMTAGAACAQPAPGKGPRPDADGDGKVTLAEFKASRAAQMMRMDTDRDGKVSKSEFQAGMAAYFKNPAGAKGMLPTVEETASYYRERKIACVIFPVDSERETGFPAIDASQYLARHGIRSELHECPLAGDSVADGVREAAARLGAGYVVMGAYGHSRFRETMFGGVTRSMLGESRVPLLLAH